ncbi:retrovirus-related pol polyprotein from transposon TNT 1-94 [Tanacetum coccineum]
MKKVIKEQVKSEVSKITPQIEKLVNEQLESEVLVRSSKEAKTSHAVAANLSELELKKILIDKMEANKSINRTLRRTDRGSKRRRSGKEPESTSAPREKTTTTAGKTTTGSKTHKQFASQSAPVEETMQSTEFFEAPSNHLTELEYFCEEVYKAITEKLDWINPEGRQYPHDLQYMCVLGFADSEKVEATLKSAWTEKDQIDNLLKERRLMRSLEKFVGGKLYEGDLQLQQKNHMILSYDVLINQITKYPALNNIVVPNIVQDGVDILEWRVHGGLVKQFSVAAVWHSIRLRDVKVAWYDVVWFSKCIPRHAFYMWLVVKRCLKTQDKLRTWDVFSNSPMVLARIPQVVPSIDVIVDFLAINSKRRTTKAVIAKLVVAASTYVIWQERNWRLFKSQKRMSKQVSDCIHSVVRLKLLSCRFRKSKDGLAFSNLWKLPVSVMFE